MRIDQIPVPEPGPGEVRVRVHACGLNRLDLWLEEGGLPVPVPLPRIQGCEIAGDVDLVGPNVSDWKPGDRVAIQSNLFCGDCEFCAQGEDSLCLNGTLIGVQRDGGFAGFVVVPKRVLVPIPPSVSYVASAALTLAGSTAMHMLTHRASVQPGQSVLVIGAASGVGSAAIQIARGLGARVLTTASQPEKHALGLRLGAEAVVDARQPGWPAQVRQLTGRRGVDWIIEHVGGQVLTQSFECLARNGTVVTCGATAGRDISLNLWPFFVKQHRMVGSYGRNRADMLASFKWAAEGRLQAVLDSTLPLDRGTDAFARLRAGTVLGKLVLTP